MQVEIRDLQSGPVNKALIAEAARLALSAARGELDSVEITLVDDGKIRDLNRRFLGRDNTTDVIAFEAEAGPEGVAGEVIIGADTARRQAVEAGHSVQAELCLLVAHGLLHVLGYEDEDPGSRAEMNRLQQQVMRQLERRTDEDD